jgi:hypothetical protein
MAFVHDLSCECAKTELDIFAVPPTQTSIESGTVVEFNPISSISDSTPIEFIISGSGQDYIDAANTQLYTRVQMVREDGGPLANGDEVGPINLTLHSLFSEVEVKLNDTVISSSNNTYAYRSYIETLLSYGPDAKESQLTAALFYKDVANAMDESNPRDDNGLNVGLKSRYGLFHRGQTVDMVGRIHSDIFFQEKYLPSDVNVRIRLVRNKDAFCLMSSAANPTFKIKIIDCKLFVRKVKLSPSVFLAHAKAFESGTAKYPIRRVVCKTFTVPTGNMDFTQESLFTGQIPCRLIMGCVDNDAFNGLYTKNPFNFKHYSLNQIKVYVDGQGLHVKPIEPNYNQRQYITAYASVFSGSGKLFQNEGNGITREDYPGGYSLYAFDLSPDQCESSGHFNLVKEGSVRVDMKFAAALPNTINVIAYAEFENIIEIDRNKNVLFDYGN